MYPTLFGHPKRVADGLRVRVICRALWISWRHKHETAFFMAWPVQLLVIYSLLIALSALMGGLLPSLLNLTHRRMQYLLSLIGGLMLGVALFHQLPHAVTAISGHGQSPASAVDWCIGWLVAGLLVTFFMIRMFHFHHHEGVEAEEHKDRECGHEHDHDCPGKHAGDFAGHGHSHPGTQRASWVGIFVGLAIHSLIDGGALAANVSADAMDSNDSGQSVFWLLGFGTFLGIVLHKPLDSLSITTVMTVGGWSIRTRNLVNAGYALMCPIGAAVLYAGAEQVPFREILLASALAFSAGVFLCISLSDLLPEVQFHSHDRLQLSIALLMGVMAAWLIGLAEHGHMHGHQDEKTDFHEARPNVQVNNHRDGSYFCGSA